MSILWRLTGLISVGKEEVRGEEVERRGSVGLGHRGGQLRHLSQPHHGPLHRVPGQSGETLKDFGIQQMINVGRLK